MPDLFYNKLQLQQSFRSAMYYGSSLKCVYRGDHGQLEVSGVNRMNGGEVSMSNIEGLINKDKNL